MDKFELTKKILVVAGLLLAVVLPCQGEAERREWNVSMSIEAKGGDSTSTEKNLGRKTTGHGRNRATQRTTQKTITRNKKWIAHVSCSGKNPPEEAQLKVFYIGYRGKTLSVLEEREYPVPLDPAKRTDVDLTSPNAKMVQTTTLSNSRRRGGGAKSKSTGDRMSGCVVQLMVDKEILKTYSSQSTWIDGLHNEPFTENRLDKKSGR